MRKSKGRVFNRVLDLAAVTAAGSMLQRAPLPGFTRMAAVPLALRLLRNRGVRNVALGLAAIALAATMLSGDSALSGDPEQFETEDDWAGV